MLIITNSNPTEVHKVKSKILFFLPQICSDPSSEKKTWTVWHVSFFIILPTNVKHLKLESAVKIV